MGSPWDPNGGQGRGAEESDGTIPSAGGIPNGGVAPQSGDPGHAGETAGPDEGFVPTVPAAAIRESVVAREEERFGGIKIGSAFFGWLTATAMTVVLAALALAAVRAGLLAGTDLVAGAGQATWPGGVTGAVMLLVIPLFAHFLGGYVAGRMARFNGVGQGLMVWLWAVLVTALVALAALVDGVSGGQFNVLAVLNDVLGFPVNQVQLGTTTIIAAIAVAALALLGAVLGGITGVHYHRKVDRVGFTPEYYHP